MSNITDMMELGMEAGELGGWSFTGACFAMAALISCGLLTICLLVIRPYWIRRNIKRSGGKK